MGWIGYGIYDGDDTQSQHVNFLTWAGIDLSGDDEDKVFGLRKTKLSEEQKEILSKNIGKVIKKIRKEQKAGWYDAEEVALDWQMLLALFMDNKLTPPEEVLEKGIDGTKVLMGGHAADFNEPSRRRAVLRRFLKKAESIK